ncbi:MAG: hypothetical protein M3R05_01070 [Chloroflexota bacterium]|nr:hypothetical protein [Chloroflexota bacterium]
MGTFAFLIWVVAAVVLFPIWGRRDGGPERAAALGFLLLGLAAATAFVLLSAGQPRPGETGPASGSELPGTSSSPAAGSSGSPSGLPPASGSPQAGLLFARYEVVVEAGPHQIFRIDPLGTVTSGRTVEFSRSSMASVDRVVSPNNMVHWRTIAGTYAGWSYLPDRSGPFSARAVFTDLDGALHYANLGQTGK